MTPELLEDLRAHSKTILVRWEALLRQQPAHGPLANPDALVYLLPETLEKLFTALAKKQKARVTFEEATAEALPGCECGNNPYLTYYIAGEQALVESVVLLQPKRPNAAENAASDVVRVVRALAREEIDTFCGICTHHGTDPKCRFRTPTVVG